MPFTTCCPVSSHWYLTEVSSLNSSINRRVFSLCTPPLISLRLLLSGQNFCLLESCIFYKASSISLKKLDLKLTLNNIWSINLLVVWKVWLSLLCFGYGWDSFTCTFPWSLFQSCFYPPGYEMYFIYLFFIRKEPRNSRQLHGFSSLWFDNSNTLHPCLRQITTLINFHPFQSKIL